MKWEFEFKRDEKGLKDCAILCAQFVREGIQFSTRLDDHGIRITLTGGF